jgi:hypothetical protein
MRLWSIHPRYLDARGLAACWREGLLARKVLLGLTKGYRNHPQLERFRGQADPVEMVDTYLSAVLEEATIRGYQFKGEKIGSRISDRKMAVTDGQLRYEFSHLKKKLKVRNKKKYDEIADIKDPEPHPIFRVVSGEIEAWEKLPPKGFLQEPG